MYKEIAVDSGKREVIRAVHISDVHIDTKYVVGKRAMCGSFLCCREESGDPVTLTDVVAGEWGSNHGLCDLPQKTFKSMLDFITDSDKFEQPDMIFWTGDNSSHNIWSNTVEEVTNYTKIVTDMFKDAIKDTDITMMPIHGNHDTYPVDEQDFAKPNSNYSINHIKEYWAEWLGEDIATQYGEYGFYSKEITQLKNGKSLPAGSRIIAYNTNVCDSLNWYLMGERQDPGHQFAWLEQTLLDVEAAGGLAIMLGHYTPSDCQHQFGVRYRTLMERFQNVVRFGITGHTHKEDYQISNSMSDPQKPVFVTEIGSSVTTFGSSSPSFKLIEFDKDTMLPINMKTYYLDIAETNETGSPNWKLLHDYIDTYSMSDLSPSSFKDLSVRIFTDPEVQTTYALNRHVQNPLMTNIYTPLQLFCYTATSEMHELHHCEKTGEMSAYGEDFKLLSKRLPQALVDKIIGNWIDLSQ